MRYFPIRGGFLGIRIFYGAWLKSINLKIYYNGVSNFMVTNTASGGSITMSNVVVNMRTIQVSPEEANLLGSMITVQRPLVWKFIGNRVYSISQTWNNNSNYNIRLPSLSGLACDLCYMFISDQTSANNASPVAIVADFEIRNANNQTIYDSRVQGQFLLTESAYRNFNSRFLNQIPVYIVCFSEGGMWSSLNNNGKSTGGLLMGDKGDWFLNINTNAVPGGSTYLLQAWIHTQDLLIINSDCSVLLQHPSPNILIKINGCREIE